VRLRDGSVLRYAVVGRGRPLVLMHTIRTQLEYFERLAPLLAAHYRVHVVDLPGHGGSSIARSAYTESFFRSAVKEFIATLDLHEVTLVGESIGGVLALTVAAEMPDRIARAIALNPYDYGERFGGGVRRSRNGWIVALFRLFGAHTLELKLLLAAVLAGGLTDPSKLSAELLNTLHRSGRRPGYRRVEHSVFQNWRSWIDARRLYSQIRVPVTLVYGRDDWSLPAERNSNHRAIPNAALIEIEGAGHFTSLERPEDVANAVLHA
jgi:pimeloyl-ACP methyl ester carboxylesterase